MATQFTQPLKKSDGMTALSRDFKTRFFDEKDLVEVQHINSTCLPENYSNSFFLNIHKRFPKTFIVITVDDKVVGYIMCRVEIGFSDLKRFKIGRKGHVISLAVLPEHRGQGIATALLLKAFSSLSENNVDECYLEVRISNKPAILLYERFNFQTLRTIHKYYLDGEDAYMMLKALV